MPNTLLSLKLLSKSSNALKIVASPDLSPAKAPPISKVDEKFFGNKPKNVKEKDEREKALKSNNEGIPKRLRKSNNEQAKVIVYKTMNVQQNIPFMPETLLLIQEITNTGLDLQDSVLDESKTIQEKLSLPTNSKQIIGDGLTKDSEKLAKKPASLVNEYENEVTLSDLQLEDSFPEESSTVQNKMSFSTSKDSAKISKKLTKKPNSGLLNGSENEATLSDKHEFEFRHHPKKNLFEFSSTYFDEFKMPKFVYQGLMKAKNNYENLHLKFSNHDGPYTISVSDKFNDVIDESGIMTENNILTEQFDIEPLV